MTFDRSGRPRAGRRLLLSLTAGAGLLALAACTSASAPPTGPTQPTVQAAATQVVGAASPVVATAQAAASPAVGTAQALASPVAGTAQAVVGTAVAVASPVATALASPSPRSEVPVRIADASLSDATPWLSIRNDSDTPMDLGGWRLEVGGTAVSLPDDAVVRPGETLTLHAGEGPSSEHELYLGAEGESLIRAALPGTPVRLRDETGQIVAEATVPRF